MEKKIYDNGDFDIEILSSKEVGNQIIVEIESPFGIDNVRVSSEKKYLDITGSYKWEKEAVQLVKKKYENNFAKSKETEKKLIPKKNKYRSNEV